MKYWQFRSQTSLVVGFCAAAFVAPFAGAYASFLLHPQPSVAIVAPTVIATEAPLVLQPTSKPTSPARPSLPTPTEQALLRAVAAITPIPPAPAVVAPTTMATATATAAPPSIASAAKMLGFVWNGGNVRIGPSIDEPIVGSVDAGDLVELIEERDGWWHIRTVAFEGWLSRTLLIVSDTIVQPTEQPQPPVAEPPVPVPAAPAPAAPVPAAPTVAPTAAPTVGPEVSFAATMKNGGNVRSGPGLGNAVVGNFHAGTTVQLLGTKAGWWKVRIGSLQGWMSGTLIKVPTEALKYWKVPEVVSAPPKPAAPAPAAAANAAPVKAAGQTTSLWSTKVAPGQLNVLPNVVAPNPRLVADIVGPFLRARTRVLRASGVDYLRVLGDAYRNVGFETSKPGVASMSWHKAGRAIDVAQSFNVRGVQGVVFVRDAAAPRYYRVLIRCAAQDGSLGTYYGPKQLGARKGYYTDVTTILLEEGFQRIAPTGGVSEAWHYEYRGGLKWSQAMQQLYPVGTLRRLFPSVWR